ncbi:MAG: hypothetical protein EHM63_06200 [Actinobacteria bacterium]|nr:MAG: hypothetical protein EHM63_06200 [Actinomycetota bacterium]
MSRKPFIVLAAVSAALLGASACSSGGGGDVTVVEAAATPQFLAEAADRTAAAESGRYELRLAIPATEDAPGGLTITGSGAFDLASDRSSISIDMSGILDAASETEVEGFDPSALFGDGIIEMVIDGDVVYIHAGFLSAFLGGDESKPWVKLPADGDTDVSDLGGGMGDATALLDLLRDSGATVTDEGSVDIDGEATQHFHATISAADALASAPAGNEGKAEEFIEELGVDPATVELPVDVYVDGEGRVRRLEMSFDGATFSGLDGAESLPDGPILFTLDFLELGESVTIDLPPADQVADGEALKQMFEDGALGS